MYAEHNNVYMRVYRKVALVSDTVTKRLRTKGLMVTEDLRTKRLIVTKNLRTKGLTEQKV